MIFIFWFAQEIWKNYPRNILSEAFREVYGECLYRIIALETMENIMIAKAYLEVHFLSYQLYSMTLAYRASAALQIESNEKKLFFIRLTGSQSFIRSLHHRVLVFPFFFKYNF